MGNHGMTDRGIGRNRAATQVVAKGKTTRNTHNINALRQISLLVPDTADLCACSLESNSQIAVAVRSRKGNNRRVHQTISTV